MTRAAVALALSGRTRLQSRHAACGLQLWASEQSVELDIVDVAGSADRIVDTYREWGRSGVAILLGPYGSGLVRRVIADLPRGVVVWNHGGSADDLARPSAPMVPAPASTYFAPLVDRAVAVGCDGVTIVQGRGGFARDVARGAVASAQRHGLPAVVVELARFDPAAPGTEAVLVVGRFEDDVAVVSGLVGPARPPLVGCVAAGIPAFGKATGSAAEGVLGPTQWWSDGTEAEVGPTATEFTSSFRHRFDEPPSYVAAQAAAAGYLAMAAAQRGIAADALSGWSTSTLLGRFQVDDSGRQVGHRVTAGRWSGGRFERIAPTPG